MLLSPDDILFSRWAPPSGVPDVPGGAAVTLIQGDCLQVMARHFGSECIDLVITDPAYESLERHRAKGTTTRLKQSEASSNEWFPIFRNVDYWTLFRLFSGAMKMDRHCYVFCDSETEHVILNGRNPFDAKLDAALFEAMQLLYGMVRPFAAGRSVGRELHVHPTPVWVKVCKDAGLKELEELTEKDVRAGMGYHWRRSHEQILFFELGHRRLNNLGWKDVLLGPRAGKDEYPTKKPGSVLQQLVLNSSQPGELVLDPFCGSGATGIEAVRLGRRAMLIDLDVSKAVQELEREGFRRLESWRQPWVP